MTFEAWIIFAAFWAVFVTTPGPNAVNCIQNGMTFGFRTSLIGVLAILTQSTLFLSLSALGVTALIAASPTAFLFLKMAGALVLIYMGIKGWINAAKPVTVEAGSSSSIYLKALAIATFNAKSVAGYLAAFSQFVQLDVPLGQQMWVIVPTALTLTTLSYVGYTAIGSGLGKIAMGAVLNTWFRRGMAICFVIYGALMGASTLQGRT